MEVGIIMATTVGHLKEVITADTEEEIIDMTTMATDIIKEVITVSKDTIWDAVKNV